mmetsp:Transcript_15165/g.21537  ORF Transcript_15165/g.21537 Transcript_15165/m.21537 type:complete len:409 (-) Transcript_15165:215-1441(-)
MSSDDDMTTLPNGSKVRNPKKCGNCGATENLRKCNKCMAEAYCSRDCQVAHWKQHKFMCKLSCKLNKAGNSMEALQVIMQLQMKGTQPDGSPIQSSALMFTHAGPVSTNDTKMPPGVPDNFLYIRKASSKYVSLKEGKREFGEAVYKKLLDELMGNKAEWERFFNFPANQTHAGDACMALDELASIYNGRGDYENCEKVLDMMEFLLTFVKKHDNGSAQYDLSNFTKRHEYRILNTRYNMNLELNRYDQNISIMREGVAFEERHKVITQLKLSFKNMFKGMADCWNLMGRTPKVNAKRIDKVSDDTLLQLLESPDKMQKEFREMNPQVYREWEKEVDRKVADDFGVSVEELQINDGKMTLQRCANCNKVEPGLGEFKRCIQCKTVVYCGKDCQKKHWKAGHKKVCVKK